MKIYKDIKKFIRVDNPVVTVGGFDGLHLGHRKIIDRLIKEAKKQKGESVLVTFNPHPRLVLFPGEKDLKLLNTIEEKIKLLENSGIDNLIIIPFTKEFSRLTSEDFVKDILVKKIGVKKLIAGYNHHIGRDKKGDFSSLVELSRKYNFDIEKVSFYKPEEKPVSSTVIRKALFRGDIEKANKMLGYKYPITGKVVRGNGRGKKIGFPTANVETENEYKLIPFDGAYAVEIELNGKIYKGMCNIGIKPTFKDNKRTVEVNIFDFNKEIYGELLTIYFVSFIRKEKKFKNPDLLREQLKTDAKTINKILSD